MAINIYILEDNPTHYKDLIEIISLYSDEFNDCLIFNPNEEDFYKNAEHFKIIFNSKELIENNKLYIPEGNKSIETTLTKEEIEKQNKIKNDFFDEIIFNNDIDLFIIDIALKNNSDILGLDFYNYLKEIKPDSFTIINSINTDDIKGKLLNFSDEKDLLVSKDKDFDKNQTRIVGHIKKVLKEKNITSSKYKKLSRFERIVRTTPQKIVNFIIVVFFFVTISISSVYSGWNIVKEVSFIDNKEINIKNEQANEKEISNKNYIPENKSNNHLEETKVLNFVEHIFLNTIPILVLLGFFSYYKYNLKPRLLDLGVSEKDSIAAKKSIQLTKTLFLSSIMSYTIIKIIDEFFVKKVDLQIKELISYGTFLVLLMSYLIITHNMDRKEK